MSMRNQELKLLLCLFGCTVTLVAVAQAPLQTNNNVAAYDAGQIHDVLSRYAKRVEDLQDFYGPESTGLRKQVIAYYQSTTNALPVDQKIVIGACFYMEQDYRAAAKLLEEYVAVFTNSAPGWNRLGASYSMLDEHEKAIPSFEKAFALGDIRNLTACCAAALDLGRLDIVKKYLPYLLRLMQEPKALEELKQETLGILAVYAERTDDWALFSKALEGVKIESLASRKDVLTVLKRVCEKFNSPGIAAQCEEISQTLQRNNQKPK